jgi:hypothetical protein
VNLTIPPLPTSQLPDSARRCGRRSLTLTTGNLTASHLWSTGATDESISVNAEGVYWAELSAGGCTRRDTVVVRQAAAPQPSLGPDRAVCEGTTLDAGAGSDYLWSPGTDSRTLEVVVSATYAVRVTAANGCIGRDTVAITVTQPFDLELLLPEDTVAAGEQLLAKAAHTAGPAQWRWDFDNRDFSPLPDSVRYAYASPGIYTLSVRVSDGACTRTDSATVVVTGPSATAPLHGAERLRVSPNPAAGHLRIAGAPAGSRLALLGMDGRVLREADIRRSPFTLSLQEVPAGLYLLRVHSEGRAPVFRRVLHK